MSLNVGQVIEHTVRADHVSISELSRKLHVSRRTIYNWFNQKALSLDTICKIGNAIKHDFSKEFPEEFASLKQENSYHKHFFVGSEIDVDADEANSVSYWMTKYINLLEKYNELLSQEISLPLSQEEEAKQLKKLFNNNGNV